MRFRLNPLSVPLCAAPALLLSSQANAAVQQSAAARVPQAVVANAAAPVASSPFPSLKGWNYAISDDETEAAWTWTARLAPANGAWEARLVFDRHDNKNFDFVQITGAGNKATARFFRAVKGVVDRQGDPAQQFQISDEGTVALQRTASRVRLLWDGRAVTSATPATVGAIFGTAARGATLTKARMQPLEPVLMRDDFMRAQGPDEPETSGGWSRIAGTWKTSNMLGPRANMELNPNPFVYRGQDDGKTGALAVSGSWFWNDYTVAAAVHPNMTDLASPLIAGLQAYRQADGGGVRGEVDFGKGIARIVDGTKVLAESSHFEIESDQWHRLYFEPGPGVVRLLVDGVERVRTSTAASVPLAQGQAGLYVKSGANSVDFDDVRVASNPSLSDDFSVPSVGRWADLAGEWQTRSKETGAPSRRVKISKGAALTVTGSDERSEGTVEARFAGSDATMVGAAFAVRDAKNYYLARRVPNKIGASLQIVSVEKGAERVLATAPNAAKGDIEVTWRDGDIAATSGNARAVAAVSEVPAGRVGAWATDRDDAKSGAATLLSFRALGAPPSWGEEKYPDIFAKDRLMQNWASAASLWQPASEAAGAPRWHVGDFFNDSSVTLKLPPLKAGANLEVALASRTGAPVLGAKLVLTSDGSVWNATLKEGGTVVGSAAIDAPAASAGVLRFARRPVNSNQVSLRVAVGGKSVIAGIAPRAGDGTRASISTVADGFDWNTASAQTSNVLDYGFTGAPVDWRTAKGQWTVAGRWTCQPQWGFFAGTNDVNPLLWSRFSLRGDWTLEAYLATPMDSTRGERSPMDLNLSIGDGRDVASGYSFLFGAAGRQTNRIMRGETIVKEHGYTQPKGAGNTHQDWFLVRLERRMTPQGLRFIYSVNGQPEWDYTDPKPLESATKNPPHLAFWTYNGGLSVARVRLWHSGIENGNIQPPAQKDLQVKATYETPSTSFGKLEPRRDGLRTSAYVIPQPDDSLIANPQSGGDWTVYVTKKPFDAAAKPTLSWRYKVGPNVLVNLYAFVDGRWREIAWTGDSVKLPLRSADIPAPAATTEADPMRIGAVDGVKTDGAWHNAKFDLRAALTKAGLPLKVDALAFAAPDRDYLRAGLGGNHLGARYEIADFKSEAQKLALNP